MASAKRVLILEMSIQVWRGASSRYHGTCRYPKGGGIVGKRGRRGRHCYIFDSEIASD